MVAQRSSGRQEPSLIVVVVVNTVYDVVVVVVVANFDLLIRRVIDRRGRVGCGSERVWQFDLGFDEKLERAQAARLIVVVIVVVMVI